MKIDVNRIKTRVGDVCKRQSLTRQVVVCLASWLTMAFVFKLKTRSFRRL